MLARGAVSWRILRWLASAGLLGLFLALHAAPLALALAPRDCGCSCSRFSPSCCCRRSTQEVEPTGLHWTSVSCCKGHCPRATAAPVSSTVFPLALGSPRIVAKADSCSLPASTPEDGGYCSYLDFAFLYQRPPPLS